MICMLLFKGKVNMDQILNSTLAGGVVMGAGADMLHKSYVAYIVGAGIGIISSLMFEYMPRLLSKFNIQDVAGVLNLHGIPGFVGGLCSAAYRAKYIDGDGRIQVVGTFISLGIGLVGGLLVGIVIRPLTDWKEEHHFFNETNHVKLDKAHDSSFFHDVLKNISQGEEKKDLNVSGNDFDGRH